MLVEHMPRNNLARDNDLEIEPGAIVKVTVPHQFKGIKVGFFLGQCKKDKHPYVYVPDETVVTKYACIDLSRGDTIVPLKKKP